MPYETDQSHNAYFWLCATIVESNLLDSQIRIKKVSAREFHFKSYKPWVFKDFYLLVHSQNRICLVQNKF